MRQVYSSPRLENVEAVAKLLNEAGIETWVSGGRSYKGSRRKQFSFREHAQEPSGVWIVNADDISRASDIVREAGLRQSTRDAGFVPSAGRSNAVAQPPGNALAMRIRLVLVVIALVLAGVTGWRMLAGG